MVFGIRQLQYVLVTSMASVLPLLVGFGFTTSEEYYIIPSPSDQCTTEHCLTLTQFAVNSSYYLTSDTTLIFAPGNHSLESKFIVENVQSFSMFSESTFSPNHAVIVCNQHANLKVTNVVIVTVIGFNEFVGCIENRVESVDKFHLKDSGFHGQAKVNSTALIIVSETNTTLDRTSFLSNVGNEQERESPFLTGGGAIMSVHSSITITQSWFEGNSARVGGAIYSEHSSITIFNSTFLRNHALACGGAMYAGSGSTVNICDSKFVQNSVLVSGGVFYIPQGASNVTINIIHSQFIANVNNNTQMYGFGAVCRSVSDNSSITFIYSEFFNNHGFSVVDMFSGEWTIAHSEFNNNNVYNMVVRIVSATSVTVAHNHFINNNVYIVLGLFSGILIQNSCNKFMENSAIYDVYVGPACKPGYIAPHSAVLTVLNALTTGIETSL